MSNNMFISLALSRGCISKKNVIIVKNILKYGELTCEICKVNKKGTYKKYNKYAFSIDHIIPKSDGGDNDINNLQASHMMCNNLKGGTMKKNILSKEKFADEFKKNIYFKTACFIVTEYNSVERLAKFKMKLEPQEIKLLKSFGTNLKKFETCDVFPIMLILRNRNIIMKKNTKEIN